MLYDSLLALITSLRLCLSGFTVKGLLPLPHFYTLLLGRKSLYRQPTPRRKELLCPLFEGKYLRKLFGIPNGGFVSSFPFMNWLNHVFMSAWAHENLFYILAVIQSYFILLLLYCVGWLLCSLAYSHQCGCWLFFKALPLFLVLPDTSDSSCIFLPPS